MPKEIVDNCAKYIKKLCSENDSLITLLTYSDNDKETTLNSNFLFNCFGKNRRSFKLKNLLNDKNEIVSIIKS